VDVLVQGAGAVGLGLASFLHAAGARLRIVARPETARALQQHGLRRTGVFGEHAAAPGSFAVAERLAGLPEGPADFVLVAVKSFDSEGAARELAAHPARCGEKAPLVLCQNGWGSHDVFAALFPKTRVWNARVITGFQRRAPHHVEVTVHAEPLRVGSLFGADPHEVAPLCAALSRGGLPAEPSPRIAEELWAKLLYNGCLNGLGAVFGVPYGALGASQPGRALLAALAEEIFAVMQASGNRTRWESAEAFLADLHGRLLPPTAAHEPSTLQDLRAGRRTEIDALNGAVVRLGDAHGVPVPVNRTLCTMLRFLEERARSEGRRNALPPAAPQNDDPR
jgi:2-dehydropantoate 2-reductase